MYRAHQQKRSASPSQSTDGSTRNNAGWSADTRAASTSCQLISTVTIQIKRQAASASCQVPADKHGNNSNKTIRIKWHPRIKTSHNKHDSRHYSQRFSTVAHGQYTCFGPCWDWQLPLYVETMDASKRPLQHGKNIGPSRAFTPGTAQHTISINQMQNWWPFDPLWAPRLHRGLLFIYCEPQELDGGPHDCCGCEFISASWGGGLGLAYSAKITHPSRNCTKK